MTATATKSRPIIFSGPMVRAILAGHKTQARRVVKHQAIELVTHVTDYQHLGGRFCLEGASAEVADIPCPYGQPGDRLWVRETFRVDSFGAGVAQISYAADGARGPSQGVSDRRLPDRCRTVPAIHMPRQCSRITLEVTGVRVERLQEIDYEDAANEGIEEKTMDGMVLESPITGFRFLWDALNAKRGFSWESNPWVWAVYFRRAE